MVRMDGSSRCNSSARWRSQSPMPGSIKLGPQIRTSVRPSLEVTIVWYRLPGLPRLPGMWMVNAQNPSPLAWNFDPPYLSGLALRQACADPWCLEHASVEKSGPSWNLETICCGLTLPETTMEVEHFFLTLEKRDSSSSVAVSSCQPIFLVLQAMWRCVWTCGRLTCRSCNASPSP